jgi:hypothetical protein
MRGEPRFNQPPADGEIRIVRRQRPDAMQVIRQNHYRIQRKRSGGSHGTKCGPQHINRLHRGKYRPPFLRHQREEE